MFYTQTECYMNCVQTRMETAIQFNTYHWRPYGFLRVKHVKLNFMDTLKKIIHSYMHPHSSFRPYT